MPRRPVHHCHQSAPCACARAEHAAWVAELAVAVAELPPVAVVAQRCASHCHRRQGVTPLREVPPPNWPLELKETPLPGAQDQSQRVRRRCHRRCLHVEEQARAASAALDRPRAAMQAAAMQGGAFLLRSPLDREDSLYGDMVSCVCVGPAPSHCRTEQTQPYAML